MPNEYKSELSPSKDIVKRLKAKPPKGFVTSPLMIESADEIERLREELRVSRQSNTILIESLDEEIERLRLTLHTIHSVDADVIVPMRMWDSMTPLECYEEGLMNGAMAVRDAVKTEAYKELEGKSDD